MINCPNPSCKTANPEGASACQVCQSVLPHYYLWGVGDLVATLKPGTLVNQRYVLKRDRIFLDTKPGLLPESVPEIPDFLLPYLHLSAYPLHVPRPYSVLRTPDKDHVLMLESSAFSVAGSAVGQPIAQPSAQSEVPSPLPRLINAWSEAPPLRQLSWLWQLAQMWDAFTAEQVAATLLDSALVRVDGSIVRLLALASPMSTAADSSAKATAQPTLVDLARSWQPLAESAHQAVRAFLEKLCENLEHQKLNAEQLSEQLSLAITTCAQQQRVTYEMSVHTDQGPTRKRNEDACFPESGTCIQQTSEETRERPQLLIVCDGIGGHQGGDVASKLAISTIQQQLQPILTAERLPLTSTELTLAIESAICAANDEISAQNDQAQRQARDRMGTTLVLALIQGSEVYIAHLGDSRAYRVSRHNCQQVTLDDDVASRQVRLGGSLYREVLVQPGSGSLIQALGMGPSQSLRPTVQRFVIDETCVFLLCSDGLSDSDRVEQFWQQSLSPLVQGDGNFKAAGPQLIELANTHNGHDNVTVGLLRAEVAHASDLMVPREMATSRGAGVASSGETRVGLTRPSPKTSEKKRKKTGEASSNKAAKPGEGSGARPITTLQSAVRLPSFTASDKSADASVSEAAPTRIGKSQQTQLSGRAKSGGGDLKKAGILLFLLGLTGGLLWSFFRPSSGPVAGSNVAEVGDSDAEGSNGETASPPVAAPSLNENDYVLISSAEGGDAQRPLFESTFETATSDEPEIAGIVPTGSIVQIVGKAIEAGESWVEVRICYSPSHGVTPESESPDASAEIWEKAPAENNRVAEIDSLSSGKQSRELESRKQEPVRIDPSALFYPGQTAWIKESDLAEIVEIVEDASPDQIGSCGG